MAEAASTASETEPSSRYSISALIMSTAATARGMRRSAKLRPPKLCSMIRRMWLSENAATRRRASAPT